MHTIVGMMMPVRHSRYNRVHPYEIKYLKIEVHNPYREDPIELNQRMSSFFKLEDVYCLTEGLCQLRFLGSHRCAMAS